MFVVNSSDTDERQYLEGYLAWKWDTIIGTTDLVDALPTDHPYKSAAPTSGGSDVTKVNITLKSVRDGYDSYQEHTHTIYKSGYGYSYGYAYGGSE